MADVSSLTEMGFSEKKAKLAMKRNGNDISRALEWLIAHAEEPDPVSDGEDEDDGAMATDASGQVANSLKCDDCGKQLRNAAAAELHAHRTGHEHFSESVDEVRPLTEEEKAKQVELLRQKLAERRAAKAAEDAAEGRKSELERRKQGKEGHQLQTAFKEKEEQRRIEAQRKQKAEDAAYHAKLKAQVELERQERAARLAGTAAPTATPPVPVAPVAALPASNPAPANTASHDEARIQLRLSDNSTLQCTFPANEPLASVRAYVMANWRGAPPSMTNLQIATTYPRKVFSLEDYAAPLTALGLVPSAALVVRIV